MNEMAQKFHDVFSSPGGEEVLAEICRMGHLFTECCNEQERIEENFTKRILSLAKADEDGFIDRYTFWDLFKRLTKRRKK